MQPLWPCVRSKWLSAGASVMFRRCVCIAPAVMLVGLSSAHAAYSTLTLACQGTVVSTTIEDAKPESVTMGIIFNFTKGALQGFGTLINYPVKITGWTDVIVTFYGSDKGLVSQVIEESIRGTLDRMTGDMEATLASFSLKTNKPLSSISYALKCRPTQRTF